MAKIPEYYNLGSSNDMTIEKLMKIISEMYVELAVAINKKPDVYQRSTDGQTTDVTLSNGDININLTTNKVEMITNHPTPATVTWTTLS